MWSWYEAHDLLFLHKLIVVLSIQQVDVLAGLFIEGPSKYQLEDFVNELITAKESDMDVSIRPLQR